MPLTKVSQHSLGNSAVTTAKINLTTPLGIANSTANVIFMAANGNIGIGTSAPGATLEVGSSINRSGASPLNIYSDLRITSTTTGTASVFLPRVVGIGGSTYTIPNAAAIQIADTVCQTGVTIANSFGLYIGNMSDGVSGGTTTNAYGIYQSATNNKNYFAGNVGVRTTSYDYGLLSVGNPSGSHQMINVMRPASSTPALFLGTKGNSNEGAIAGNNADLTFGKDVSGTYYEYARLSSAGPTWYVGTTASTDDAFLYVRRNVCSWSLRTYSVSGYLYIQEDSSSGGVYLSKGATGWAGISDERLKNITGTFSNPLNDIAQIEPIKFNWKADASSRPQVGVTAQSVQSVLPEAVEPFKYDGDDTEYLGVKYTELIPLMIASIQELKEIVETQAAKIAALEGNV